MNSYVDLTRPVPVFVDIGIALHCGCYLSTESWELQSSAVNRKILLTISMAIALAKATAVLGSDDCVPVVSRTP